MDNKTIDRIVWWIPFKQLRNDVRDFLNYNYINYNNIIKNSNSDIKNDVAIINSNLKKINNEINDMKNDLHYLNNIIKKHLSITNIIFPCNISDTDFYFYDSITSNTVNFVKNEMEGYNFHVIDFKEGDIVIDIGANVGMVSIYLAKKYPFLKIYAFEPVKQNYENLLRNIDINNIPNGVITAENVAITKDRRSVNIITSLGNTGGSSFAIKRNLNAINSNIHTNIKSMTFDDIFDKYNIDKCKLLKIDCEGAEFEILYSANEKNLKKCENMRGEFHGNKDDRMKLDEHCRKYIKNVEYHIIDFK